MGSLFSSGSTKQKVESTTTLPDWVNSASKSNIDAANAISARPFQPYGGPRVAPFTADTMAGFQGIRNNQGNWQLPLNQAMNASNNAMNSTWNNADWQSYMNPYMKSVTDEINRQAQMQIQQNNLGQLGDSAYGGSRTGVAQGQIYDNSTRAAALAQAQAFQNAQGAWQSDQNRALAGSALLGQQAQEGSQLGYQDASALLSSGQQQQQQVQNNYDQAYQDYLNQWQYPMQMLNLRESALSATPYNLQTTQSQTVPGSSLGSNLAAFGSLAGGLGSIFGTGGLSSLLGGGSSAMDAGLGTTRGF